MYSIRGREFSNKSFFKFPLEWIILRVVEDGGNNWRKSSLTICPDVLLKHKKPWGSAFRRVDTGIKLLTACWGLCVVWKMIYSHICMALYGPCLRAFYPTDLTFFSKVKACKRWPQPATRVVLPQNAFIYHKSHSSCKERQARDTDHIPAHGIISSGTAEQSWACSAALSPSSVLIWYSPDVVRSFALQPGLRDTQQTWVILTAYPLFS